MSASVTVVGCAATANAQGKSGLDIVRNWPGGWKASEHAKNVKACFKAGLIAPWRWVPVPVDPGLLVYVASDALAIGTSPRVRIPLNQSGFQRLLDWFGAQLGRKLLMMTPKISDARHLACVRGSGRVVDQVSIWDQRGVKEPPLPPGKENQGANVDQWLRQQERIDKAITAAGGYPATGLVSTLGKDVVLSPSTPDRLRADDVSAHGERGAKLCIYGWHKKAAPPSVACLNQLRQEPILRKDGTPDPKLVWTIQQTESFAHVDMDNGEEGSGGFWDYSQILVPVLDDCVLNGKVRKLADIYQGRPDVAYVFNGAPPRPIPARYPLVPPPLGAS